MLLVPAASGRPPLGASTGLTSGASCGSSSREVSYRRSLLSSLSEQESLSRSRIIPRFEQAFDFLHALDARETDYFLFLPEKRTGRHPETARILTVRSKNGPREKEARNGRRRALPQLAPLRPAPSSTRGRARR